MHICTTAVSVVFDTCDLHNCPDRSDDSGGDVIEEAPRGATSAVCVQSNIPLQLSPLPCHRPLGLRDSTGHVRRCTSPAKARSRCIGESPGSESPWVEGLQGAECL